MGAIVVGPPTLEVEPARVLDRRESAALVVHVLQGLAERVVGLRREVGAPLLGAHLQAVVVGGEDGLEHPGLADRARLVRPPRVDVGRGGSRPVDGVVLVDSRRHLASERSHVGRAHAVVSEKLLLHRDVHLVGVGPDEVERRAEHLGGQREAGTGRVVDEGEGVAAGRVAIGIREREHLRERLAERERLVVRGGVPLVAGGAPVEDAEGGADGGPAVAEGIPGDADARRDVVPVGAGDAAGNAGIAREEQALGGRRGYLGLLPGDVGELAVLGIRERELHVVAQAEVQRHPRVDAEVVLREQAQVPSLVRLPDRRVLGHGAGQAQEEIGVGVAGLAPVEGEDPVVVEQRVVDDALVRHLGSELERVVAAGEAQHVPDTEVVAAGIGSRDRGLAREVPGDGEPGKRGIALDREVRVQVAERGGRVVDATRRTAACRSRGTG